MYICGDLQFYADKRTAYERNRFYDHGRALSQGALRQRAAFPLENLPEGPINLGTKLPKIKEGMTVSRHEAPRGQLTYMVVGDNSLNNYRVSAHVPSYKNTPTVPHMLRGNTVADAGLIIASIDPCFSCLDR